jgi:S-adenosylmethionine hydrolase
MGQIIGLLTDFGTSDVYVGVMKAVMLGIDPAARLVDITHQVQPQNVRQAAFALLNSVPYFLPESVFLVVVDPGVGSARRHLVARIGSWTFVAPDNGVLSYVLAWQGGGEFVQLTNPAYQLGEVSDTFHGRDVFAPAAAHLALGVPLNALGVPLTDPLLLPAPELTLMERRIAGEVVHIDHFGNIVTSIGRLRWVTPERLSLMPVLGHEGDPMPIPATEAVVSVGGETVHGVQHSYSEGERGALLALVGSNGYLEVAVNQGNCAARLDVAIGDPVILTLGVG